ncbi:MAG TPA: extracellular solute-binding protein [Candidatus Dormibacteraeota bacterium]|nr:extracellular solute-binding protein [Candidatus Dormibacteraeota bacterium]
MSTRFARLSTVAAAAMLIVTACSSAGGGDWTSAADAGKAKDQAKSVATYGAPNDWANYGQQFTTFCQQNFQTDCNTDHQRSLGEDMSSAEEIAAFDSEKNAPKAGLADIGILFAGAAEQKGVLPNFTPDNAKYLPANLKGANGGWVATFVGVPGFVVNTDYLKTKNVAVPTTWADLAKPDYKGMIGLGKPGSSGTATMAFVAMNLAAGGTLDDYTKGVAYAKDMIKNLATSEGNADSFEKGEVPIQIKYDFNLIALANEVKTKNVNAQVVIPTDGSIYAPSAIIANKYDTAHMDFIKLFMNWILSDQGQIIFAKFGARPIRSVVGDTKLVVPDSAKTLWLPDDQYKNVQVVDTSKIDISKIKDIWVNQVGGAA